MHLEKIINELVKDFNHEIKVVNGLSYLSVNNTQLHAVLINLKNNSFNVLIDCFAANTIDNNDYNTVYYHLLSYKYNKNMCVYTRIKNKLTQSIIDIFPNANWYEREIYEMYNIEFTGHNNLKKLFTNSF